MHLLDIGWGIEQQELDLGTQKRRRGQTKGVEVAYNGNDVFKKGLDLSGSVTYADSRIMENAGFVTLIGDTIGKYQPRVPVWRATALVSYRFDPKLSATFGARYSGPQFSTLDNSEINGFAYQGTIKYFTTDVRVRYQVGKQWVAAVGIDNLNNYTFWNFHPYPQQLHLVVAHLKIEHVLTVLGRVLAALLRRLDSTWTSRVLSPSTNAGLAPNFKTRVGPRDSISGWACSAALATTSLKGLRHAANLGRDGFNGRP